VSEVERAIILVKAAPHPSRRYHETVCCAGVTPEGQWRRLYPVRYRHLTGRAQFSRWDLLEYRWRLPKDDARPESRRVEEQSLRIVGKMRDGERAGFFDRLLRPSYADAALRGETLTLVRPKSVRFRWRPKKPEEIEMERGKIAAATAQGSLLDAPLSEMDPCPMHLFMGFEDAAGKHAMMCGDWETSAAFWKWRKAYGEERALADLKRTYEQDYFTRGMALALGTVAKRPRQWLLLGIVRLDEASQSPLF
jgi:uncharacterized protein YndB with AHSA1/START domain